MQAFDVYRPSGKFSRKNPGTPTAIVAMAGDRPPGLIDLKATEAASDGTPVLYATVSAGTVTIFQI